MKFVKKDKQLAEKVHEGRAILLSGEFPGDIIEQEKNSRNRRELTRAIFQFLPAFDGLKPAAKKRREQLLKVQLTFTDYLSAKEKYRPACTILFLVGFMTYLSAFTHMNHNLYFGISTGLLGLTMYGFSLNRKFMTLYAGYLVLFLMGCFVLELIFFGIPETYFEFMYRSPHFDVAMSRRPAGGAMMVGFNESTPYLFLVSKFGVWLVVLNFYIKQKKYLQAKQILSSNFTNLPN